MPTIRLPQPHPAQKIVLAEAKKFNALCCGRRWGKTQLGIDRLLNKALERKPVAWYAPNNKDSAQVWREISERARPIITRNPENKGFIELIGGGRIDFWSFESRGGPGRGRAYARIIIDEAAKTKNLQENWEQVIRPQLADYDGDIWFLSTPKGTANYFFTLFQHGRSGLKTNWASWKMPTSTNPYIKSSVVEEAREDLTELAFAQEYLAQFVSWEGAVFRRIEDCVSNDIPRHPAAIIGVDWGRTNDYTVFIAISAGGVVLELDRFRGIEYSLQRARLETFWQRNERPPILAEQNSIGGPNVEQLQRDGLPVKAFVTTHSSKCEAIEALALAFERGEIVIPNDPVLIGELQAFEGKTMQSGMIRYAAGQGAHDDTVMALAIGWQGIVAGRKRTTQDLTIATARGSNIGYDGRAIPDVPYDRPSPWRL